MKKILFAFLVIVVLSLVIGCGPKEGGEITSSEKATGLSEREKCIKVNAELSCQKGDAITVMKKYGFDSREELQVCTTKYGRELQPEVGREMMKICPEMIGGVAQVAGNVEEIEKTREEMEQWAQQVQQQTQQIQASSGGDVDWGDYDISGAYESGEVTWCSCFINGKLLQEPRKKVDCESKGGNCIEEWSGAD